MDVRLVYTFLVTYKTSLFSSLVNDEDIRERCCFSCFSLFDPGKTTCEKCEEDRSLIRTWCNPRGKSCHHPEGAISNQTGTFEHILCPWTTWKRNPSKIHPTYDFSGPIYDGYLDSLLITLFFQKMGWQVIRSLTYGERHPFDYGFWKESIVGIDALLDELSGCCKYPDIFSVLKNACYVLVGVNEKSHSYYGDCLWNNTVFGKLFDNYATVRGKFVMMLVGNTSSASPITPHIKGSLGTPEAGRTPESLATDLSNIFQTMQTPMPTSPVGSVPSTFMNYLMGGDPIREVPISRKQYVKSICSNMYTSVDIITMLLEKRTHVFANDKVQKLVDACNFQVETLNFTHFNILMCAVTPENITDTSAIYDHIGHFMLKKREED